jgi:hypothetical protein
LENILLRGVVNITPMPNENSLCLRFWNGIEIVVSGDCQPAILARNDVLVHPTKD